MVLVGYAGELLLRHQVVPVLSAVHFDFLAWGWVSQLVEAAPPVALQANLKAFPHPRMPCAGPADEPPTPSAAAAVGALLAARNSAPVVDAPVDVSMEGQPATAAEPETQEADPALQLPPELEKPPDKPVKAGLQVAPHTAPGQLSHPCQQ